MIPTPNNSNSASGLLQFRLPFLAVLVLSVLPGASIAINAEARQRIVPSDRIAINYSYAPVVKQALPAVVNVYVRHRTRSRRRLNPFANDPFFRHFFGGGFGVPRERIESSLGSGVIVSADGLVVTNFHVIERATSDEIKVALPNRQEFKADILLRDKKDDLAVLKIRSNGRKFPFLKIANSDQLEVGDLVLAMGNPFGVGQTVTSGIVSALARTGIGKGDNQYFIQTDAAINPGNSGGALVDMKGELVGINTAIYSKSGGSLGIGFAIPSNLVSLVVNSARNGHTVQRPWFGGTVKTVTAEIAEGLQLPQATGVYIALLADQSPARNAGLRVGDVITSINGHSVLDARVFRYHFTINGTGGVANLTIWRRGRTLQKKVRLVRAPEIPPRNETRLRGNSPFSGAVVANLSPALAEEMSMNDQSGVVVMKTVRRSVARQIGLTRKDILLEINGVEVESVAGLVDILRDDPGYWRFMIKRGENILSLRLGR